MNILIFIDHEIVFRNFMFTDIFEKLCKRHQVTFIFPEKENKRFLEINLDEFDLPASYLRLNVDNKRYKLWNRKYLINQMRFKFGEQNKATRNFRYKTIGWKSVLIFTFLGLPVVWSIYSKINELILRKNKYLELINLYKNKKPKIIIHPTVLQGTYVNDLIYYSKIFNVTNIFIMNSWDNPSTKRSLVGNPDWLLVWGEQTKRHAEKYMKMNKSNILKFGAIQFEGYSKPLSKSRDEFCEQNNLHRNKKIILYAGSSKGTKEIEHLKKLDKIIEDNNDLNMSILYRPHPWGNGGYGGENILKQKWKNIFIENSMQDYLHRINKGNQTKELKDPNLVHDILGNVDAVISPLSTILIEAALHGKPSICVLPYEDKAEHFMNDVTLIHFKDIFNSKYFKTITNTDDFEKGCKFLLLKSQDIEFSVNLRKFAEFFVLSHKKKYKDRICDFVEKLN